MKYFTVPLDIGLNMYLSYTYASDHILKIHHTSQPISFKIWDNGPSGSVAKILKNHTFRNPDFWKMYFRP